MKVTTAAEVAVDSGNTEPSPRTSNVLSLNLASLEAAGFRIEHVETNKGKVEIHYSTKPAVDLFNTDAIKQMESSIGDEEAENIIMAAYRLVQRRTMLAILAK